MYCVNYFEDINKKGQDNVSPINGKPLCEDCYENMTEDEIEKLQEPYDYD